MQIAKNDMTQGVQSRLMRGFAAQSLSQVISIIIQVVSVPLFLGAWGKELYGEWLLLSTIPTYFSLSDLGFSSAASSEMTMCMARGERENTIGVYQSAWLMVSVVSVLITLAGFLLFAFAPLTRWLNISVLNPQDCSRIAVLFVMQIALSQQIGILMAGYRCDGNFALGTMANNMMRLAEFAAITLVLLLKLHPLQVAQAVLLTRFVGFCCMWLDLTRRSNWLQLGLKKAKMSVVKRLVRPAFAFNGMTIGYATNLQGMLIVVGACFGPVTAALFSTMRTLTRLIWQLVNTISVTVCQEMSVALGVGDKPLARRLHRRSCQIAVWLALGAAMTMWILGEPLFTFWTKGRMNFDRSLFTILLLVVIISSLWATSMNVQISVNRHQKLSLVLILSSVVSVAIAWVSSRFIGIYGVALSLLVCEICMSAYVVRRSLVLLDDNWHDYAKHVMSPPAAWIWSKIRTNFFARRLSQP